MRARWLSVPYTIFLFAAIAAGQNQPLLAVSPERVVFPATPLGSQTAPLQITVTNTAKIPVTLQEIIISGIDFAQTNDCGQQLAAGGKCSIQVVFKPAISGERIGSVGIVAANDPQPNFIPLTGVGE